MIYLVFLLTSFQREQEQAGMAQPMSRRKLRLSMQPSIAALKAVNEFVELITFVFRKLPGRMLLNGQMLQLEILTCWLN